MRLEHCLPRAVQTLAPSPALHHTQLVDWSNCAHTFLAKTQLPSGSNAQHNEDQLQGNSCCVCSFAGGGST